MVTHNTGLARLPPSLARARGFDGCRLGHPQLTTAPTSEPTRSFPQRSRSLLGEATARSPEAVTAAM